MPASVSDGCVARQRTGCEECFAAPSRHGAPASECRLSLARVAASTDTTTAPPRRRAV